MEPKCAVIKVTGRVQGVGFRYSTLVTARNLQLTGYVKNLPDESVYIVAQGNPDAVNSLVEWCRTGPPRAIVESVEISACPLHDFSNFRIF